MKTHLEVFTIKIEWVLCMCIMWILMEFSTVGEKYQRKRLQDNSYRMSDTRDVAELAKLAKRYELQFTFITLIRSSSPLVPRFRFSRYVASPGETWTITSCTWKRGTISDGPQIAKTEHTDSTNLTEFPWEHLSNRQQPPPRTQSTPTPIRFQNCTEPHKLSPQGD